MASNEKIFTIPHHLEAEKACIGSILLNNSVIDTIFTALKPNDFYDGRHQIIAKTIFDARDVKGEMAIDLVTLTDLLKQKNELKKAGDILYLNEIIGSVPTTRNVEYYRDIVKEKSRLRMLVDIAKQMETEASSNEHSDKDVIEKFQNELFSLTTGKYNEYESLKEILQQTVDQYEENYKNRGKAIGIESFYTRIDTILGGLHKQNLIVIGGRPSMGKTAFALSILQNIAITPEKNRRIACGLFSLEMSKIEICLRLLCMEAKLNQSRFRKNILSEADWSKIVASAGHMHDSPIFIDDSPSLGLYELAAKARKMVHEGVQVIVVDYMQLIDQVDHSISREQHISNISRRLKQLARELEIPIVALTQLNRSSEARTDKRPMLSDIRESGAVEQDADVVCLIHRPSFYKEEDKPNIGEVMIAKNRHGQTGTVELYFQPEYPRFDNYSQDSLS